MSKKPFSVITFLEDNSIDFVPSKWITSSNGDLLVRFPRGRNLTCDRLRRNPDSLPKPAWPLWSVKITKTCGMTVLIN